MIKNPIFTILGSQMAKISIFDILESQMFKIPKKLIQMTLRLQNAKNRDFGHLKPQNGKNEFFGYLNELFWYFRQKSLTCIHADIKILLKHTTQKDCLISFSSPV